MCNEHAFTRRAFLQKGLTLVSTAATAPYFLQSSALGMTNPLDVLLAASVAGVPQERILVVVQLGGGNDGLNTVVPFGDAAYYRQRPGLGIRPDQTLKIKEADGLGFHPNLAGLKALHDDGLLCTIQGVGYPNPNRSHFTSMDIWHTADPKSAAGNGWIGRYFDNTCNGTPEPNCGVSIGRSAPKAMIGDLNKPISFETAELFRWIGEGVDPALAGPYDEANRAGVPEGMDADSQLGFLTRTALDAQVASEQIRSAVRREPLVEYPGNELANQLRMVAAMIRAELPTRVYYVTLGGFDTHAGQAGPHGNLMNALGSSLKAFHDDLKAQGNDGRVLTMTFSEFGRRVAQNASGGTDHGTAAPMFLLGPMVKAGFVGRHPSLTDLEDGDLKFGIDFRSVYASVLETWLKADSRKALKAEFKPLPVFEKKV